MMEKRFFKFAGMEIEILMPKDKFYKDEYRLSPFRVNKVVSPYVMEFQWKEELSKPKGEHVGKNILTHIYANSDEQIRFIRTKKDNWETAELRVSYKGKKIDVEVNSKVYPEHISLKSTLECMGTEHLIIENNGFLLHSSFIKVNNEAILFTAPSETGKSTQAELWRTLRDAEIINGDRAAVRWEGNNLFAEGIPFAGSSQYCRNESIPLRAIVCLAQAPATVIRRIQGYEAFYGIWKECSVNAWDSKDIERLSAIVTHVVTVIPVFYLACTPDESAIIALEKALMESEKIEK